MDWSGCELVEVIPGRVPLVKGTGLPADTLLGEIEPFWVLEDIAVKYPDTPLDVIRGVLTYAVERLGWDDPTLVGWSGCDLVERVPGRCSGAPTIVGTRIFPDTIAKYYWSGATVEEIAEDYPSLSAETILGLIDHVKTQKACAA
jgi:uncharacterized protein (DUF433 family)